MNRDTLRSPSIRRRVAGALAASVLVAAGSLGSASASSVKATPAKSNGVGQKTPTQILSAAVAALRSAHGFVMSGKILEGGKTTKVRVVYQSSTKFELSISQNGQSANIILLPSADYIKADKAFWTAEKAKDAAKLANHWIGIPASSGKSLTSDLGLFSPTTLSRCLGEDVGTLSRSGPTTVNGRPAVVIHDAGNVPGSSVGNLAVAADGPAYPLRITESATRGGGKIDVCNDGKADTGSGTLTLTDFNQVPAIKAPSTTVKLGSTPAS